MPMIRIVTSYPYRDEQKKMISQLTQDCMEKYFATPKHDCFHLFEQILPSNMVVDKHFGVTKPRSEYFILFYITAGRSRTAEQKKQLMKQLTDRLSVVLQIPAEDVMFIIVYNQLEDWCFGAGERADIYKQ